MSRWVFALLVIIVAGLSAVVLSYNKNTAHAFSVDGWADVYDVQVNSYDTADPPGNYWHMHDCEPMSVTVEHPGRIKTEDACVTTKNKFSIASFKSDESDIIQFALKKPDDTNFHLVMELNGVVYSPVASAEDHLATSLYSMLTYINGLPDSFQDFITHVDSTNLSTYYTIDTSHIQHLKDGDNSIIYARNIGMSSNGRYAVAEVFGQGIVVADLDSLEVKYIAKDVIDYMGTNYMRLTVSDDGSRVAVVSDDYRLAKVYSVDAECSYSTFSELQKNEDCYSIDFSYRLWGDNNLRDMAPYDLYFNSDKSQLVIKSYSKSGQKPAYL